MISRGVWSCERLQWPSEASDAGLGRARLGLVWLGWACLGKAAPARFSKV